jgi:hypothetical protein
MTVLMIELNGCETQQALPNAATIFRADPDVKRISKLELSG